ncbi:MAG: hypothetical protein JKX92_12290 [Porticoccaceae bacterium]|nr:hypothetical protein [Porticoccaceae bacterium]
MRTFKPGEEVSWVISTRKKHGFRISTKRGKVISADGEVVQVRYQGKQLNILGSSLQKRGDAGVLAAFESSASKPKLKTC